MLEIGNRRLFSYESVYFDTADLGCYHAHRQGRRHRYKVRSRTYPDSGACALEVKTKGLRGRTTKMRIEHPAQRRHDIGDAAAFIRMATNGWAETGDLRPVLVNDYRRMTLVDLANSERITCDVDITAAGISSTGDVEEPLAAFGAGYVLMEVKAVGGDAAIAHLCHRHGVRAVSVRKYAVGTALVRPDLPANRWHRLLGRHGRGPRMRVDHGDGRAPRGW